MLLPTMLGLTFDDDVPSSSLLALPGWLVVLAWLILFPLMGYASGAMARPGQAAYPKS
ncbi:hypothetical protein [Devosia pacifica]|uniref:hypothetical protein n=1 Tax=Devosia pacifica TaxID=1335967 RepID=UPI00167B9CE8|nr:hypothetical protein [Devosia pacifica]